MLISKSGHREATYGGRIEQTAAGLHASVFRLFSRYVPPYANVVDLGSGDGAWAKRLHDAQYRVTACDRKVRKDRGFPYHEVDLNANSVTVFQRGSMMRSRFWKLSSI